MFSVLKSLQSLYNLTPSFLGVELFDCMLLREISNFMVYEDYFWGAIPKKLDCLLRKPRKCKRRVLTSKQIIEKNFLGVFGDNVECLNLGGWWLEYTGGKRIIPTIEEIIIYNYDCEFNTLGIIDRVICARDQAY